MKIIFLIPPSEWKKSWGTLWKEVLSFLFQKPKKIALWASEKDLKCKDARFQEAKKLNISCVKQDYIEWLEAIQRYNWVMYTAINYVNMTENGKKYFQDHFYIVSWMYGLVKAQDVISNYKLPIETKGLIWYWWKSITKQIQTLQADLVIDLLPNSYKKMIDWKALATKIIHIEFMHTKNNQRKKMAHGVKIVKGKYISHICETGIFQAPEFWNTQEYVLEIDV